jgi:DNA-binding NarL/FixJ family response regulator
VACRRLSYGEHLTYGSRFGQPLTPHEVRLLRLRATGHTIREIARASWRSNRTVERQFEDMAAKLGTRSPALLALWAVHLGHVDPAEVERLGEMRWRT